MGVSSQLMRASGRETGEDAAVSALQWLPIQVKSPAISGLRIEGLHHVQDHSEVTQQRFLLGLFRDFIAAQEPRVFMPQANDFFDQVQLSLREDDPIVEAAPLIEVVFKHTDRPLKRDELLRTRSLTSAPVLTLPIPSVGV